MYRQLFGKTELRVALLNATAVTKEWNIRRCLGIHAG